MPKTEPKLDAVALLKADHREAEALFESFEKAKGAARKREIAEQVCTALKVHTLIEEEIFYPACRGEIEDDLVNEAYVEHDGAKTLINEIMAGSPDEAFYDAKVKVLSEMIEHHVEEEEKRSEGMFSQARKAGLDMDDLGERMKARKDELMVQFEATGAPPAETRTFEGDDTESALSKDDLSDEPVGNAKADGAAALR